MNKDYWKAFYRDNKVTNKPSSFAIFFAEYAKKHNFPTDIIDLGCGNGRDTYFLRENCCVLGLDRYAPKDKGFVSEDVISNMATISLFDVVYSRFFLHTQGKNNIKKIIYNTRQYFVAETRSVGDNPIIYADHKRHFTDANWLLKTLIKQGFEILYFEKGYGLAKFKEEDPLIIRIIAKRNI